MSAENFLSRLSKVRRRGRGQWSACCPAHDDKSPSLSVRELDDGRVLCHCFGGCTVDEVLGAVDMDMTELMPERIGDFKSQNHRTISASHALELLASEAMVVMMYAKDLAKGDAPSENATARLMKAVARISSLRLGANHGH